MKLKNNLKEVIKNRFPFVRRAYWFFRSLSANLLGTKIEQKIWAAKTTEDLEKENSGLNHPHRGLLIEKIAGYQPFSNVLEIGCGTGNNLYLLARLFPKVNFEGIDINNSFIENGRKRLLENNISNVELLAGDIKDLKKIPDKSFDIVFSDAFLIYVGEDKIKEVIEQIKRISKKVIILLEHHSQEETALGRYNMGNWLRDYLKLFQFFDLEAKASKLPPEIWGGDWAKYGYFIEVKL